MQNMTMILNWTSGPPPKKLFDSYNIRTTYEQKIIAYEDKPLLICPAGTISAASLAANSFGIMVAKFMEALWAQQM